MNDDASGALPMIACHECGTVQHMRALPEGGAARCARCGATLYRQRRDSIEHTLLLTLAALILFVIANTFPFLTFELEGNADTSTLLTGVRSLYEQGMWPLAVLVLLTATVVPLAWLLSTAYVLLPLWLGRVPWGVAHVFRFTELLRPWAMMEVYLLGVIVAYVKLSDLARLELGIALFAFVGLIVVMIAAEAALEPHEIWRRLGPQASARQLRCRRGRPLISCHNCDQLALMPPLPARATAHCPRCGAAMHRRKPNSIARTWALVVTAAILYVPANLLPVMTLIHFGRGEPDTILSGRQAADRRRHVAGGAPGVLRQHHRARAEADRADLPPDHDATALEVATARPRPDVPDHRAGRPLVDGRHLHDLDPGGAGEPRNDRDDRAGRGRDLLRRRGDHHDVRLDVVRPEADLGCRGEQPCSRKTPPRLSGTSCPKSRSRNAAASRWSG